MKFILLGRLAVLAAATVIQFGCFVCADVWVEHSVSGRAVDSSGVPVAGTTMTVTLLREGKTFAWGSDVPVSEDDGSFVALFGYIGGPCGIAGLGHSRGSGDDGLRPDAAQFRLRYEGCIRETMVAISEDQIGGEYPSLTITLGDVEIPDCQEPAVSR